VNLPTGAVALGVIASVLSSSAARRSREIDYLGAALLTIALTALILFTVSVARVFVVLSGHPRPDGRQPCGYPRLCFG
jgi:hypothetical protein